MPGLVARSPFEKFFDVLDINAVDKEFLRPFEDIPRGRPALLILRPAALRPAVIRAFGRRPQDMQPPARHEFARGYPFDAVAPVTAAMVQAVRLDCFVPVVHADKLIIDAALFERGNHAGAGASAAAEEVRAVNLLHLNNPLLLTRFSC